MPTERRSTGAAPVFLAALATLATACPVPATDPATRLRADSVTREAFERILPELQRLRPGDDADLFYEHVRIFEVTSPGQRPADMVVLPGWIGGMSGSRPGLRAEGFSALGRPFAKQDGSLRGRHVFGYVWGGMNLAPRFQVVTEATPIEKPEYEQLEAQDAERTGIFPGESAWRFFRDFRVVETGFLPFRGPSDLGAEGIELEPMGSLAEELYSEHAFRETEQRLRQLPVGTDFWSVLSALRAFFVTRDYGQNYAVAAKGFWGEKTRTIESDAAIHALRAFGYIENEVEVIALIAIFENDRLQKLVPHSGLDDWSEYLAEP